MPPSCVASISLVKFIKCSRKHAGQLICVTMLLLVYAGCPSLVFALSCLTITRMSAPEHAFTMCLAAWLAVNTTSQSQLCACHGVPGL